MKFYRDSGAHRARHAEIFPQPRADDGVHGVSAGAADRAGLRVRRKNQGRGHRVRGSGPFRGIAQSRAKCSTASRRARRRFAWSNTTPLPRAVDDLQAGFVQRAWWIVPHDFSRRVLSARPAAHRVHRRQHRPVHFQRAPRARAADGRRAERARRDSRGSTARCNSNAVEMYPYIEYIKYLLAGSTAMAIFIVAMIGGGITFIDDKSRGLHEGYLVTPIKKIGAGSRADRRGRDQGTDGGDGADDHRRTDRGHSRTVGSGAAVLSDDRGAGRVDWR